MANVGDERLPLLAMFGA